MADLAAADQAAQDEAVRLAAELIRIDTTNRGGGDARERPAAEHVAAALAEAGLDPVLLERTPGRTNVVARIERATAWLKLTARGTAGHGSRPNPRNAVTALAGAVTRIGAHTWPVSLIPTVRAAVAAIAGALGLDAADAVTAAERDPGGLLARLGPAAVLVEPVLRNSANPTMLRAGYKVNVIPGEAVGYVDGRVLPGG